MHRAPVRGRRTPPSLSGGLPRPGRGVKSCPDVRYDKSHGRRRPRAVRGDRMRRGAGHTAGSGRRPPLARPLPLHRRRTGQRSARSRSRRGQGDGAARRGTGTRGALPCGGRRADGPTRHTGLAERPAPGRAHTRESAGRTAPAAAGSGARPPGGGTPRTGPPPDAGNGPRPGVTAAAQGNTATGGTAGTAGTATGAITGPARHRRLRTGRDLRPVGDGQRPGPHLPQHIRRLGSSCPRADRRITPPLGPGPHPCSSPHTAARHRGACAHPVPEGGSGTPGPRPGFSPSRIRRDPAPRSTGVRGVRSPP